ncbi:MAG: 30S ribosomal protein S21 [Patescibacteria group bacterium]|nr:30S ribosomal protein S21 [Patescibacteria group bacterium]
MPLRVQKQNRESSQNVIRRFSQKIRQSGILLEVRKRQFKGKKKSEQLKKRSALRREEKKREYEKLKKLGKL